MKYKIEGSPTTYEGQIAVRKAAIDRLSISLKESVPIQTSDGIHVGYVKSNFDFIDFEFRYSMHYADGVVVKLHKDGTRNLK